MAYLDWLERLNEIAPQGYWKERIAAELKYMEAVYCAQGCVPPPALTAAVQTLLDRAREEGAVTKALVQQLEGQLSDYRQQAKRYKVICAAHAHIDMNWEWGFDETVGVVIDTFQTMLNLMEEYPQFHFSQSQASTYEIIERFCPSMLEKIRARVREGRWEVTASTWVEHDKNMAGTEAMLRHLLYARSYLSELLGVSVDALNLDFEPDTFGHSANVPEVLNSAGVKYYYQCRGYAGRNAYRFRAPSGAEVLAYNEPNWYLGPIEYDMFDFVPGFCCGNGTDTALEVYGVGDHGGGPTRRDIERIKDMMTWPLMADIRFGTIGAFYRALEAVRERLPVVDHELNFVFTGCYTSQSRIKRANRHSEDKLYDSETLCAMARQVDDSQVQYPAFEKAWRKVLFNQFHDILPGSCVRETREHALAMAAEADAYALANANRAMKAISDAVDTSLFGVAKDPASTAEGAGPGFGAVKSSGKERLFAGSEFTFTSVGRGGGDVRAYTLYNTTQFDRNEVVELVLWDWKHPARNTVLLDGEGRPVRWEHSAPPQQYWQHEFQKIVFEADVPAFGYATYYVVRQDARALERCAPEPRVHRMEDGSLVLENAKVRAEFATDTMKLISFIDKGTGRQLVAPDAPAGALRLIDESEVLPYNAWTIGNYGRIEDISQTQFVNVKGKKLDGLRRWIEYEIHFRSSSVNVRVSLDEGAALLRYSFEVDWNDRAIPGVSTPQLRFQVPYAYGASSIRYDVPAGWVDRPKLGHDVPAIYYAAPVPEDGGGALMLTSDCKYGYRASDNYLDINLLRSSYAPDIYPEVGIHRMEIGVGAAPSADWFELRRLSVAFSHPVFAHSASLHAGKLPARHSFMRVEGRACVAAVKAAEANCGACLFRIVNQDDHASSVCISMDRPIVRACETDTMENEKKNLEIEPHGVRAVSQARSIVSVVVQ